MYKACFCNNMQVYTRRQEALISARWLAEFFLPLNLSMCMQIPYIDLIQTHDIEFGDLEQLSGTPLLQPGACFRNMTYRLIPIRSCGD